MACYLGRGPSFTGSLFRPADEATRPPPWLRPVPAGRVVRRVAAAMSPMQRPGTAGEVAAASLWLLSAGAIYTTGATLDVGGGR